MVSYIGSVVGGVENIGNFALAVADTLAYFYGGQSASLGKVPDGGFADAEL